LYKSPPNPAAATVPTAYSAVVIPASEVAIRTMRDRMCFM
jgi:hypothetical protein